MVLLALMLVAGAGIFYTQFSGPGGPKEPERFIVRLEEDQPAIIADLADKKFFRNQEIFIWLLSRQHREIAPGAYLISKNMNVYQLAQVLTTEPYQKWVVIPAGKRKEQVAVILKRALDWPEKTMINFINLAKEGWLFGDTYLINSDADAQQAFEKLFATFNEKLDADLQKTLLAQNIRLDTAVRFASLIEREAGGEADKAIIAGIIWNRLDKGMRLEIDATVQYALTSQALAAVNFQIPDDFNFWEQLSGANIRANDSPFNTYQNKGLPPGPICSPSISSIWAVAQPAETDAFYYLHSADKQIHTAVTYKEHLKNIQKYL